MLTRTVSLVLMVAASATARSTDLQPSFVFNGVDKPSDGRRPFQAASKVSLEKVKRSDHCIHTGKIVVSRKNVAQNTCLNPPQRVTRETVASAECWGQDDECRSITNNVARSTPVLDKPLERTRWVNRCIVTGLHVVTTTAEVVNTCLDPSRTVTEVIHESAECWPQKGSYQVCPAIAVRCRCGNCSYVAKVDPCRCEKIYGCGLDPF